MGSLSSEGWPSRCQRCSAWEPRARLLRQLHKVVAPKGENRLPWSEPADDSAAWDCTSVYIGTVSPASSSYYIRVNADDTTTDMNGAPTWVDSGRLDAVGVNVVDVSTWTSVVLMARMGPEARTGGELTVVIGLRGGSTDYPMRTVVLKGLQEVVATIEVTAIDAGDRGAMTPYVDVTVDEATTRWWVAGFHVIKDSAVVQRRRGVRITTSGTAIVRAGDEVQLVSLVVCPRCRRKGKLTLSDYRDWDPDEMPDIAEDLDVEG